MALSERKLEKNGIELIGWDEVFNVIPKWNNYYLSNYGRLLHKYKNGNLKLVNLSIVTNGYLQYTLSKPARMYHGKKVRGKNGKPKTGRRQEYAHRLVAELYIKSYYSNQYDIKNLHIHHKDKDVKNNYYKNLMYLEPSTHKFVDSIRKMGSYNHRSGRVYCYKDIERLADKAGVQVLEFIDYLRYGESERDGKWNVYNINGYHVAVEYFGSK